MVFFWVNNRIGSYLQEFKKATVPSLAKHIQVEKGKLEY